MTPDQNLSPELSPEDLALGEKFLDAIKTREKKFADGWWKGAEDAEKIYNLDKAIDTPFNILYSNTEVLAPSLFSAVPRPDVRARHGQKLGLIPTAINRFLEVAIDPAAPGADSFETAFSDAVLAALVPGLGYVRIRYVEDRAFPIVYESGHYKTLIWGHATRWAKVPWVAFKHPMKKEELFRKFDVPEADRANYSPSSDDPDEHDDCCVYELWDKATRKVYFLSEEWKDSVIRVSPDPLGLENFFPTPGPLLLTAKPGKLLPTALYSYYKKQAEELNRTSARLEKVLSAIRVRGAYNSLLGTDLGNILSSDSENGLVPASEAGLLMQSGGFDKQIWFLPIEMLVKVARELYSAREATKQVIYELTGISDIIRGSSVASETATAQDLKSKWGTVRLRKMQTLVANYARDILRLTVDCASDHVPPEQWAEITQLGLPTPEEKAQAQAQLAAQAQAHALQSQMLPPGAPQPPPPQPDPALVKTLQSPTMQEILAKIKSDQNRAFLINIETNSTQDLDSAQDKPEVTEYMNGMGQMLSGLQPLLAFGAPGLEAVKSMLVGVSRRFKFGQDIADKLEAITLPPPPPAPETGPSPAEKAVIEAESQQKLAEIASKQRILLAQEQLAMAKIEAEKAALSHEIQASDLRLASLRTTLAAKDQAARLKAQTPPNPGTQNAPI